MINVAISAQLFFAVAVQLILVVVMIHGVRSERRALLLPYIVFVSRTLIFSRSKSCFQTAIAIIAGFAQLASDFVNVNRIVEQYHSTDPSNNPSQFVSHLIATLIHAWCLSVVWRCYGYLGEKKIARQISEQLNATHAAFHYPEQFYGFAAMPQPPPYADTVTQVQDSQRSIIKIDEDKQPLTIA